MPTSPARSQNAISFQSLILALQNFWARNGCIILQPVDAHVGAGTFHPATTLHSLGASDDVWNCAYVQPSRRPADGRYGENPNRLQHYYQFQVLMKPAPKNIQDIFLESLDTIGLKSDEHDIRFVEDDWESPTLGAWGLGWEVWCDGMEITQFTYFQQVGGFDCTPFPVELTYGLERLAMYVQGVENVFDLIWNYDIDGRVDKYYREIFHNAEVEYSKYNFEYADIDILQRHFEDAEKECSYILKAGEHKKIVLPAYDQCLKASHIFNLLDARGAISVTQRQSYISRVRALARSCAAAWLRQKGKDIP